MSRVKPLVCHQSDAERDSGISLPTDFSILRYWLEDMPGPGIGGWPGDAIRPDIPGRSFHQSRVRLRWDGPRTWELSWLAPSKLAAYNGRGLAEDGRLRRHVERACSNLRRPASPSRIQKPFGEIQAHITGRATIVSAPPLGPPSSSRSPLGGSRTSSFRPPAHTVPQVVCHARTSTSSG